MFSESSFRGRFREFILTNGLVHRGDRLLLAVSGGADSIVLLDLLAHERKSLDLSLVVAHVNHGLRGIESDGDEEFVRSLATSLDCELVTCRENVADLAASEKAGIQESARRLRYTFFEKAIDQHRCNAVATGHNADDNAETVLLNLLRGSGIAGLGGIPAVRSGRRVIRPILFARRDEIERYAGARGLTYRTDSSNHKDTYRRNYLRHEIIPLIRAEINPNLAGTLRRTAEIMQNLHEYLAEETHRLFPEFQELRGKDTDIPVDRLSGLHPAMRTSALAEVTHRITDHQASFDQIAAIEGLLNDETGSAVRVNREWAVFRERKVLAFRRTEGPAEFDLEVMQNQEYRLADFRFSSEEMDRPELSWETSGDVEFVDAAHLQGKHLRLRTWRAGDEFIPLGMKNPKKISDFFVDEKVPLFDKRSFPLLETDEGEIVWVCGKRIDDRFRVTATTRRVLRLEFRRTATRADG
jgi:tRNA(Ile)-lysidine synthase